MKHGFPLQTRQDIYWCLSLSALAEGNKGGKCEHQIIKREVGIQVLLSPDTQNFLRTPASPSLRCQTLSPWPPALPKSVLYSLWASAEDLPFSKIMGSLLTALSGANNSH